MLRLAIAHNRLSSSFNAAFIDTITHSSPSSVNVAVGDDMFHIFFLPGRVAQLVAHLTQEPDVPGSIPGPAAYFVSPSAGSRSTVVSYGESMCTKYWLTASEV